MKKVIVTGANGFVGSALVRELLDNGVNVIACDRAGCNTNLPKGVTFVEHELSESDSLKESITDRDIDVFYHLAWVGSAGNQRANTQLQLNNAQWTVDCLNLAKEIGCKKFVCAGSITEDEALLASSTPGIEPGLGYVYGAGKLAAHVMCMSIGANLGIDVEWAKITNAYGPGEKSPRLINSTIKKCLNGEIPEFTAGLQNYDFVYIDDVAKAFRLIGEFGKPFTDYVIGSSSAKSLRLFLEELEGVIQFREPFKYDAIPFNGVSLPLTCFDSSALKVDTGFFTTVPFAEGCYKTLKWWRENEFKF